MRLLGVDRGAQEGDNCVVSCLVNNQTRRGGGNLVRVAKRAPSNDDDNDGIAIES